MENNLEAETLTDRVAKWLESEGYPFELYVGEQFRLAGWSVQHAVPFVDALTDKTREIDLVCSVVDFDDGCEKSFEAACVVECKSTRDKPWVVFKGKEREAASMEFTPGDYGSKLYFELPTDERDALCSPFEFAQASPGHGIVKAFADKRTPTDPTGPYSALQSVTSAVRHLQKEADARTSGDTVHMIYGITLYAPLVVIDGYLFECTYSETMKIDPVDRSLVETVQEPGRNRCVWIVTKEGLGDFLAHVTPRLTALAHSATPLVRKVISGNDPDLED